MEALLEREAKTEPVTEPRIPAAGDNEICCAAGCWRSVAIPERRCQQCGGRLCRIHAQDTACPGCKGGK